RDEYDGGVELLLGSSNKTNGRRNIFQSIQVHQGDVKEVRVRRFQTNQDTDVNRDPNQPRSSGWKIPNQPFDESPPLTKLSPLVDDDVGEEKPIRKNTKIVNTNNEDDESIKVDEIVNIKESKNHLLDQVT
ncbi:hypothetical protein Tco_0171937, partial [Tanacetum coccineum]